MKKIICICFVAIMLLGAAACGQKKEETYPQLVNVEETVYSSTDKVCENVPRRMADGFIETFVPEEIMPDTSDTANFGSEYETLEYMFLEGGELIVKVGDTWYYFEQMKD